MGRPGKLLLKDSQPSWCPCVHVCQCFCVQTGRTLPLPLGFRLAGAKRQWQKGQHVGENGRSGEAGFRDEEEKKHGEQE